LIGETVGNYRVLKLIGQGGMGVVYLAEHPAIGRKAAIKVLRADAARSPEAVIRFFNEARAANAVRRPGVVEVFDYGALPSGATYIAMELLEPAPL
jgi:eukaryotic-like serine/threonine-protein kinase